MDWVKVYESHNEYEWSMQVALSYVEPWGDDRSDMRAAVNTAKNIASQRASVGIKTDDKEMTAIIHGTRRYLKIHDPDEDLQ